MKGYNMRLKAFSAWGNQRNINQSEEKTNQAWLSRASCRLHVIASSFNWTDGFFSSFVIGESNYFDCRFTVENFSIVGNLIPSVLFWLKSAYIINAMFTWNQDHWQTFRHRMSGGFSCFDYYIAHVFMRYLPVIVAHVLKSCGWFTGFSSFSDNLKKKTYLKIRLKK